MCACWEEQSEREEERTRVSQNIQGRRKFQGNDGRQCKLTKSQIINLKVPIWFSNKVEEPEATTSVELGRLETRLEKVEGWLRSVGARDSLCWWRGLVTRNVFTVWVCFCHSFSQYFKTVRMFSGQCGSAGWALSRKAKDCLLDSWSGHVPGLQVQSPVTVHTKSSQSMFLSHTDVSLPLSPSLPLLSKK